MQYIAKSDADNKPAVEPVKLNKTLHRKRSAFAREAMLDAFGKLGHLHDDQCADHVNISPKSLAKKRERTMWREATS